MTGSPDFAWFTDVLMENPNRDRPASSAAIEYSEEYSRSATKVCKGGTGIPDCLNRFRNHGPSLSRLHIVTTP